MTLLTEAYEAFITVGDLKQLGFPEKKLTKLETNLGDKKFTFAPKFLNYIEKELTEFSSTANDTDIIFTIDTTNLDPTKTSKFKISKNLEDVLNTKLSPKKVEQLGMSGFQGFINKLSTDQQHTSFNKGDVDELLLGIVIFCFLVNKKASRLSVEFARDILDNYTSESKEIIYETKVDTILYRLQMTLKYPKIIQSLVESTDVELQTLFFRLENYLKQNSGPWSLYKNKKLEPNSIITVSSVGQADSKLDKSDWKITLENSSTSTSHPISVKSNSETFHRFSCLNLDIIRDTLAILGITLTSDEELVLKTIIDTIKRKTLEKQTKVTKTIIETILRQGSVLTRQLSSIIKSRFNKMSPAEKINHFIINPSQSFIKGIDQQHHQSEFTICDLAKDLVAVIPERSKLEKINLKSLKLIETKGIDNYPILKLLVDNTILYGIRFTKRNLNQNYPRIEGMFEISNINNFKLS